MGTDTVSPLRRRMISPYTEPTASTEMPPASNGRMIPCFRAAALMSALSPRCDALGGPGVS